MQPDTNNKVILLLLATESIAAAIKGCADRVETLRHPDGGPSKPGTRAIEIFGPLIVNHWANFLGNLQPPEQEKAFRALAGLVPSAARQLIDRDLKRRVPAAGEDDRLLALNYLSAIPSTTRDMLLSDGDSDDSSATIARFTVERSLLRFLPMDAPPFPVESEVPGTPYRLEELLGSGGFGAVYRAVNRFEQNTPPRAIKFCLNRELLASLQRERELLDRLMSAGKDTRWSDRVVKLYGHNLDATIPFLVYEYIAGGNLITRLAAIRRRSGTNLRPSQVLGLIRRICEPIAFAHGMGLVHRDIKPSNILVSGNTIKLADFGIGGVIAMHAAHSSHIGQSDLQGLSVTEKCSLFRGAGTPLYMSPEQRRGEAPDPRHDVYSIGVMWYQLLVGDCTRELHQGWHDELADEHDIPQKQIDLIQTCVGYIKKRPATAGELLASLPSPGAAATPTVRVFPGQKNRIIDHLDAGIHALSFSPDSRRLYSAGADGKVRVWDVESAQQIGQHTPNAKAVPSLAISADGRRALFGCDTGTVWLWDLQKGTEVVCLSGHTRPVGRVAFSPDGRRAVTGSDDATIRLWHVPSGRELLRIDEHEKRISGLQFTPDGLFIVSCSEDGMLGIWDSETGWETQQLSTQEKWLLCLAVSPDGRHVACGGKDHLTLWALADAQVAGTFSGHDLAAMSAAFSPSGQHLLSGSMDKTMRLWEVVTRKSLQVFEGHTAGVTSVAFSPDGCQAASAGFDRTIRLWSLLGRV
jgi:serine/threonine protein kinase